MFLLFNMLSRFVIVFLSRGKYLSISWLQSPSTITLDLKKIKSVNVSIVSPYKFNCVPQFLLNRMFIIIHFQVYPNSLFLRQRLDNAWASLVSQMVKNFPANAGDTRGPGSIPEQEDPLEKIMAICSNSLA